MWMIDDGKWYDVEQGSRPESWDAEGKVCWDILPQDSRCEGLIGEVMWECTAAIAWGEKAAAGEGDETLQIYSRQMEWIS
jgi:hypothetical protein